MVMEPRVAMVPVVVTEPVVAMEPMAMMVPEAVLGLSLGSSWKHWHGNPSGRC